MAHTGQSPGTELGEGWRVGLGQQGVRGEGDMQSWRKGHLGGGGR